jgi:hypothetical protein
MWSWLSSGLANRRAEHGSVLGGAADGGEHDRGEHALGVGATTHSGHELLASSCVGACLSARSGHPKLLATPRPRDVVYGGGPGHVGRGGSGCDPAPNGNFADGGTRANDATGTNGTAATHG